MHDHYPSSEPGPIFGSQFTHQLNEQLLQVAPEAAAQSDPRELVDMIRQLPDTVEGWRAQQVTIGSEAEAQRIKNESTLYVVDHVARQPIAGFAQRFLQTVDDQQQVEPGAAIFSDALLPTVFARSMNNPCITPDAALAIAHWTADRLDDAALVNSAGRLASEARDYIAQSELFSDRIRQVVQGVKAKIEAAARQDEITAATNALRKHVGDERLNRDREARKLLEAEAAAVLMSAKDANDYWAGYAVYKEQFPYAEGVGKYELNREAEYFERWRFGRIKANTVTMAEHLLEQFRAGKSFEVPQGCQGVEYEKLPSTTAIFPDVDSLVAAMDDFYAPRNGEGRLLDDYPDPPTAEDNKRLVDQLLSAIRSWAVREDAGDVFKDPLQKSWRSPGQGDILEYRDTALDSLDIEITRRPDGSLALNQTNVGLYAGVGLAFGDSAEVKYRLAVPPPTSQDERHIIEYSKNAATLRLINRIPAHEIAEHVANVLEPAPTDAEGAIYDAIVKPDKPYDPLVYRYPSTTLEVCGATLGVSPDFHNPQDIGYLPPDPESGAYTKTRAVIFDKARTEWAHAPVVSFGYDKLSHDQAATLWALAQPQRVRDMI